MSPLVAPFLASGAAVLLIWALLVPVLGFFRQLWHMQKLTRAVPGPAGHPVLGNILDIATKTEHELFYYFMGLNKKYGSTVKLWIGHVLFFVLTDPEDLQVILSSQTFLEKSFVYKCIVPLFGRGLTALGGRQYRTHRKAHTASLHLDVLNGFVPTFSDESRKLADTLCELADSGEEFNVQPLCGHCANSTVIQTILCANLSDVECDRANIISNIDPLQKMFMYRIWHPWLLNDWLFSWTKMYPDYRKAKSEVDEFVRAVLRQKLRKPLREERDRGEVKCRKAFLDHMLASPEGAGMSEAELFEEAKLVTVVGSASSMDTLATCFCVLSVRQDIQDKVQEEIDSIFGSDHSRPVTPADLSRMEYTERFIKETMRCYTGLPIFARECPEDVKLPSGYTIPKGAQITFFLPATHRNPQYFPEPEKLDPDRFLPENISLRHPYSYIPFSAGPRNCVAKRYVMRFLKTTLANVMRQVRVLPAADAPERDEDLSVSMTLLLTLTDTRIRVQRRNPLRVTVDARLSVGS